MSNLNITFEPVAYLNETNYRVSCDVLPLRHDVLIYEHSRVGKSSEWSLNTCTRTAFGRRKRIRRGRWFKTLDDAKAAAVAYIEKKVAASRRQTPVPHGHGEYFQSVTGEYWAVRIPGTTSLSYIPVGTKKEAKKFLENLPQWVLDRLAAPGAAETAKS